MSEGAGLSSAAAMPFSVLAQGVCSEPAAGKLSGPTEIELWRDLNRFRGLDFINGQTALPFHPLPGTVFVSLRSARPELFAQPVHPGAQPPRNDVFRPGWLRS